MLKHTLLARIMKFVVTAFLFECIEGCAQFSMVGLVWVLLLFSLVGRFRFGNELLSIGPSSGINASVH